MRKVNIDTVHAEIATTIRLAKKRLFKQHRETGDLMAAYRRFSNEVHDAVERHAAVAETREVPTFVTELKADLEREGYSGPTRAQNDLAGAVAEIITNDAAPPRLRDGVVDYVADAPRIPHSDPPDDPETETSDKPPVGNAYDNAMRELGLDWPSIHDLTELYLDSGDDRHLVVTIGLLGRLANLARMREKAPEDLENYLPLLIMHMYRSTYHCEKAAEGFAEAADVYCAQKGGEA